MARGASQRVVSVWRVVRPHSVPAMCGRRIVSVRLYRRVSVVSPPDGQWGSPLRDGSVSGMIGMVVRREAHIAIDEITITAARDTVVDFSRPYYMESSTVLSSAPALASKAFAVFSPFTPQVWALLIACVALGGPLLVALARSQERVGNRQEKKRISALQYSFNAFRVFLNQDNRAKPHTVVLRFFFGFYYVFSFLVYALYAGTLTAVLTAPTYERPIDSLSDLLTSVRRDGVTPLMLEGSSIHELFASSESGVYRDIYEQFSGPGNLAQSLDEGVGLVLSTKSALIEATLSTEIRATLRGRARFYLGRQSFYPQAYGIACRKGSPYISTINVLLSRMLEAGLIGKWKSKELKKVARQGGGELQEGPKKGVLTLTHLQGAFFLYGLGSCCASLVLLMELLRVKMEGYKNQKTKP